MAATESIRERHLREMEEYGWGMRTDQLDGCGGCGRAYAGQLLHHELGLKPNCDDLCQDCAAAGIDPEAVYAGGQHAARARREAG